MAVSPELTEILAFMDAVGKPDLAQVTPADFRESFAFPPPEQAHPVARVKNKMITGPAGELPIRIYTPHGDGPFPVLVYFHGGGFVICDLDSHDDQCRKMCDAMRTVVVSVDYRLAPEAKFPAAPQDCFAATRWCAANQSMLQGNGRLTIGGDSAGGCLAAAVSLMAKAEGGPTIDHQFLIYPVTNCAFDTPSYQEFSEGYFLERETMRWFWRHYLASEEDASNPLASPLLAPDLSGLPAATVITAGYDPLRDEGRAYADKLAAAGVPVSYHCFDDMVHGYLGFPVPLTASAATYQLLAQQQSR